MQVSVRIDAGALRQMYRLAPVLAPKAIARGLNRAGRPTETKFRRDVMKAMGLMRVRAEGGGFFDPFRHFSRTTPATPGRLRYQLAAFGGRIPLKYFGARETRRGVSAAPMNQRQIFPGTFIKGGRFPKRKGGPGGQHVWQRTSSRRLPIEKQYGPGLPEGFVQPQPVATWESEGGRRALAEIVEQFGRILSGAAPA